MPQFRSPDGLAIQYRVLGKGDPVVLLHGWTVCGKVWSRLTGALVEAGKQLIIPDQRGAGASDKPATGYTLELYAADLLALVDDAKLDRFKLVGHTMGGQTAQLFATAHSDRIESMTLVNSVPASGVPLPPDLAALFRNSGGNRKMAEQIIDIACRTLDADGRHILLAATANVSPECVAQSYDAWSIGGFADRLSAITCKTFVLGSDDPFFPPDFQRAAIAAPIPGAEFVYLPGLGHYPQVENPGVTAAKLIELLS
jgi:non-heme chloroperoxidase